MSFMQFLSAFGLGAVVTTLVQAWLSNKADVAKRNFQEKKESYIGFLDAILKSEIENTEQAALNAGHWVNRIDLVGSPAVMNACIRYKETNPIGDKTHPERPQAIHDLKEAMRNDLGVGR